MPRAKINAQAIDLNNKNIFMVQIILAEAAARANFSLPRAAVAPPDEAARPTTRQRQLESLHQKPATQASKK